MLLRRVELTPSVEEVITSVNSTVLLSITVRLNHDEFAMCIVSTVMVTTALSHLLLKKLIPSMSAVMSPTSWSSMQNVYLVVSCPSQSSSLCIYMKRKAQANWAGKLFMRYVHEALTASVCVHVQYMVVVHRKMAVYRCSLTFLSVTFINDLSSSTDTFTFTISTRPGPT